MNKGPGCPEHGPFIRTRGKQTPAAAGPDAYPPENRNCWGVKGFLGSIGTSVRGAQGKVNYIELGIKRRPYYYTRSIFCDGVNVKSHVVRKVLAYVRIHVCIIINVIGSAVDVLFSPSSPSSVKFRTRNIYMYMYITCSEIENVQPAGVCIRGLFKKFSRQNYIPINKHIMLSPMLLY